jgi:hypothetical protein
MHDKPGTIKLDVNSPTFDADLDTALVSGYKLFAVCLNFVILSKGYTS